MKYAFARIRAMRPFDLKFDRNVLFAQAYGCWLYVQIGSWGLFLGSAMPFGLRAEWTDRRKRLQFRHHDPRPIVSLQPFLVDAAYQENA